jgi:NAD(P)-dependent dehydrogenase (short-subunit alcohol dehydrogenase family)
MERDAYWNAGTNNQDAGTSSPTKNSAAIWTVDRDTWEKAGGITIGTADPPKDRKSTSEGEPSDVYRNCYDGCFAKRMAAQDKTEIGTLKVGKGRIVIFGALLPQPTELFAHWFGLNAYSVSAAAQTMLLRVLGGKA